MALAEVAVDAMIEQAPHDLELRGKLQAELVRFRNSPAADTVRGLSRFMTRLLEEHLGSREDEIPRLVLGARLATRALKLHTEQIQRGTSRESIPEMEVLVATEDTTLRAYQKFNRFIQSQGIDSTTGFRYGAFVMELLESARTPLVRLRARVIQDGRFRQLEIDIHGLDGSKINDNPTLRALRGALNEVLVDDGAEGPVRVKLLDDIPFGAEIRRLLVAAMGEAGRRILRQVSQRLDRAPEHFRLEHKKEIASIITELAPTVIGSEETADLVGQIFDL